MHVNSLTELCDRIEESLPGGLDIHNVSDVDCFSNATADDCRHNGALMVDMSS